MTEPISADETPRQDQLLTEASFWWGRMRGPGAETYRPEFEAWLNRGAAHLGAYNRAAEIFSYGKFLGEPGEAFEDSASERTRSYWPRALLWTAGGLVLAFVVWVASARPVLDRFDAARGITVARAARTAGSVQLSTGRNSREIFMLDDGSSVALEPSSRLIVAFSARQRSLRLALGRGRFAVRHEQRPFVVYAGAGSVTAHGTEFDVWIDRSQLVMVQLLRGAVDVALPTSTKSVTRRLAPGQHVVFAGATLSPHSVEPTRTSVMPVSGVEQDLREFENERVSAVVALANARSTVPIALADPKIGDLQISGRFSVDDTQKLADRLAGVFGLDVDRSNPSVIAIRRTRAKNIS